MFSQVTIIGVGLLGGSIGLAIKQRWPTCRVVGVGHRESTLRTAMELNAIDHGETTVADGIRGSQLVIICTPVSLIPDYLRLLAASVSDGTIITDVGSTKASIVAAADRLIPDHSGFVGSHPMAGSEKRSVVVARADLFVDATCVITPSIKNTEEIIQKVQNFWNALGMKTVRHTPEDHDKLVAFASHLPHIAAAAIVRVQTQESIEISGKGYADTTRIASGDPALWRDILSDNRVNVIESVDLLIQHLQTLRKHLANGESPKVEQWLAEAASQKSST